jgi:hypothetical protein
MRLAAPGNALRGIQFDGLLENCKLARSVLCGDNEGDPMEIITLERRAARGRSRPAVPASMPRGKFAEIFAYRDAFIHRIPNLASAFYEIRKFHASGADLILIGMSKVQGMKISQDSWGFITVLIGLLPATLQMNTLDDEVQIAFAHGALKPAGVIGFLWEDGNGPGSRPPEPNSTLIKSRLDGIRHLCRLNLAWYSTGSWITVSPWPTALAHLSLGLPSFFVPIVTGEAGANIPLQSAPSPS